MRFRRVWYQWLNCISLSFIGVVPRTITHIHALLVRKFSTLCAHRLYWMWLLRQCHRQNKTTSNSDGLWSESERGNWTLSRSLCALFADKLKWLYWNGAGEAKNKRWDCGSVENCLRSHLLMRSLKHGPGWVGYLAEGCCFLSTYLTGSKEYADWLWD